MSDQIEQIVTALNGCCAECADRDEHIAWAIHEHAPAGLLAAPEHDAAVAAKAWGEAVAAVAWAMDRGPDPLRYVAETNPYEREAGESGADT